MATVGAKGVVRGRAQSDVRSGYSAEDVGQREDLANFISMLTRDETPFMSSIGKTKATAIYHEWQTDKLASPGNSKVGEGTDYILPTAYVTGAPGDTPTGTGVAGTTGPANAAHGGAFAHTGPNRTRLGNYTQINGKTIAISGTRRAIDQAGVADEYAYQLKKRGTELRRDIEQDLIHNFTTSGQTSVAGIQGGGGTATTPITRSFGSVWSWINKNLSVETGLNAGGNVKYKGDFEEPSNTIATGLTLPQKTGNAASTPGKGSLALSDIDEVMQSIYQNGGKANKIMLSPKLRRDFSDLMVTDSGVRRNIDMDGKLRQSVDVYMSDFGDVMVVPNYIMGLTNTHTFADTAGAAGSVAVDIKDFAALVYDPQWFAIATLRPLQEVDVGQRGDSTIGMMVEECTLEVKNPQGCGAILGLN